MPKTIQEWIEYAEDIESAYNGEEVYNESLYSEQEVQELKNKLKFSENSFITLEDDFVEKEKEIERLQKEIQELELRTYIKVLSVENYTGSLDFPCDVCKGESYDNLQINTNYGIITIGRNCWNKIMNEDIIKQNNHEWGEKISKINQKIVDYFYSFHNADYYECPAKDGNHMIDHLLALKIQKDIFDILNIEEK